MALQEAEILKNLYHKNIIKFYGKYSLRFDSQEFVLIFEYCEKTLK